MQLFQAKWMIFSTFLYLTMSGAKAEIKIPVPIKLEVKGYRPKASEELGPEGEFRPWKEGCTVHNMMVQYNSRNLKEVTPEHGCEHSCQTSFHCYGAIFPTCLLIDDKDLYAYYDRSYRFSEIPPYVLRKNFYVKDCRKAVCNKSCHCYDGDPGQDKCSNEDEEVARSVLKKATKRLIKVDGMRITLRKNTLDKWLKEQGQTREDVEAIILRAMHLKRVEADVFEGMKSLKYLNLDDNLLYNIDGIFKHVPQLEVLLLMHNRITEFSRESFRALTKLKYLDISLNPISDELREGTFKDLKSLETLHIATEKTALNISVNALHDLKNLAYISMSGEPDDPPSKYHSYDPEIIRPLPKLKRILFQDSSTPIRLQSQINRFSTACRDGTCFDECGAIRPNYLSTNTTSYDFHLDLQYVNTNIRRQRFYVQTAYLQNSTKLVIPDGANWEIVAKELLILGDVFRFTTSRFKADVCVIRPVRAQNGQTLFRFYYEGLDVIARKIHVEPGAIHEGICEFEDFVSQETTDPSVPDEYLDAVVKCADLLTYSSELFQFAMEILDSAVNLYSVRSSRGKSIQIKALTISANAPNRWTARQGSVPYVPLPSLSVHAGDCKSHADDALFDWRAFERIKDEENDLSKWSELYLLTANMTTKLKDYSETVLKNAREEVKIAHHGVKLIRHKYKKSLFEVTLAKKKLLEAIDAKKIEYSYAQARSLLSGVTDFFQSVVEGALVGSATGGYDLWKDYSDYRSSIADLNNVAKGCAGLLKILTSGQLDVADVQVYLTDLDKASKLKAHLVKWNHLALKINVMLRTAGLDREADIADFEFAIRRVANWGKKLTEEVITEANVVRKLAEKLALRDARRAQVAVSKEVVDRVASRQKNQVDLLAPVERDLFDERLNLLEIISLYCQSFFHYYLLECDDETKPSIYDGLRELIGKALSANGGVTKASLYTFMRQPLHFTETMVIADAPNNNQTCVDAETCPITAFKKLHSFTFSIPLDSKLFRTYDRVRLREVQIKLIGVKGEGSYSLYMRSEPVFKDRFQYSSFEFYTMSRFFHYKLNLQTNEVNTRGKVHEDHTDDFSEITPFTDWLIGYIPEFNTGIDFSGVTAIHITFKGSAISRQPSYIMFG